MNHHWMCFSLQVEWKRCAFAWLYVPSCQKKKKSICSAASRAVCAFAETGDFRVRGHEESLYIIGATVTADLWPDGVEKS
jgi:hypothetical protein